MLNNRSIDPSTGNEQPGSMTATVLSKLLMNPAAEQKKYMLPSHVIFTGEPKKHDAFGVLVFNSSYDRPTFSELLTSEIRWIAKTCMPCRVEFAHATNGSDKFSVYDMFINSPQLNANLVKDLADFKASIILIFADSGVWLQHLQTIYPNLHAFNLCYDEHCQNTALSMQPYSTNTDDVKSRYVTEEFGRAITGTVLADFALKHNELTAKNMPSSASQPDEKQSILSPCRP